MAKAIKTDEVAGSGRIYFVDWLRTGAMLLLIMYHTGRLFDEPGWHIKNATLNFGIEVFNRVLDVWHMPLFFLLAGASVWFSMSSRTPGAFSRERLLRLFVPLVFGVLIIVPPQVYLERIFDGDFTGSFFKWYPNTFSGIYSTDNAQSGNFSWHHLWFLIYLFVFSLILLPAFSYFRRQSSASLRERIAAFLEKPGALFLATVPLIIYNITLRPLYGWGNQNLVNDWANFLFYGTVFFYGFILVSDRRILTAVRSSRYVSLAGTLIFTFGVYLIKDEKVIMPDSVLMSLIAISCWCWLLSIIGFGMNRLNINNRFLKYASEALMPVYILHQSIIVTIGFYVVKWDLNIAEKYFLISSVTLASSLVIYELIRRANITRVLFGLKVRRPLGPAPMPVPENARMGIAE